MAVSNRKEMAVDLAETEDNHIKAMTRIIAFLFALADIAERAAARSRPVRAFLLFILRRADHAAQAFVFEDMDGEVPAVFVPGGSEPADALALAKSLRSMAIILDGELAQDELFAAWWCNRDAGDDTDASHAVHRIDHLALANFLAGLARLLSPLTWGLLIPRLDTS